MTDSGAALDEAAGRRRRRQEQHQLRHNRRAALTDLGRPTLEGGSQKEPSVGQLLSCFSRDSGALSLDTLRRMKRALAAGPIPRAAFSEPAGLPHRLRLLLDRLKAGEPEEQLEAAACLTNMAAGPVSAETARAVGGYLVTLSASANHLLQDQCIWALGNMACSGPEICALLAAQGAPAAAISCLKSQHEVVRYSAAAAVAALITYAAADIASGLASEVLPVLPRLVSLDSVFGCLCASAAADVRVAQILTDGQERAAGPGARQPTPYPATGAQEHQSVRRPSANLHDGEHDLDSVVFMDTGSEPTGVTEPRLDKVINSATGARDVEPIHALVSTVSDALLRGLTCGSAPAVLHLLLRTLTSLSRLRRVCVSLLTDGAVVRLLMLLLEHDVYTLRVETLPLVANLLYMGDDGDGDGEQRRDQLRLRLAPLLEKMQLPRVCCT